MPIHVLDASLLISTNGLGKATTDGPNVWSSVTPVEQWGEVAGFWFQTGIAPVIAAIEVVKQRVEDLSLP